jgi:hypothetical protein
MSNPTDTRPRQILPTPDIPPVRLTTYDAQSP